MPDAAIITAILNSKSEAGVLTVSAFIAYLAYVAWSGARGKSSSYPVRDEKHDANQGMSRETQQMIVSGFNEQGRQFDKVHDMLDRMDERLRSVETISIKIEDRTHRK